MKELISIVVPVYLGEPFIVELIERIRKVVKSMNREYEIILVNDDSPDDSWKIIVEQCEKDEQVKGINLSRNFGQHYAISAGVENARGEWIVVMDCDLQDVPEEIEKLYIKAKEGFQVVLAQRDERQDGYFKRMSSFLFYRVLSWLAGTPYDHKVANFGLYHRKVISSIRSMGDSIRFFPSMVKWVGFKTTSVIVQHADRKEGSSSYNLKRLMYLALDIILSFSEKPIRLAIKSGILISVIAFCATIYTLTIKFFGKIEVPGYASIIISIWFLGGLTIAFIGLIGLYVGKTFQAARRRPIYIISDKLNM